MKNIKNRILETDNLKSLTRWNKYNIKENKNTNNILNSKTRTPDNKINHALLDYSSGEFTFKKDIAYKHNISLPSLVRHAKLNNINFVKKSK
jgi:hypothetical protein